MIKLLAAVALVGATVHTGDGPPLENATVVIEGNRIQAVGVGVPVPADAQRIDLSQRVITPGLIDAYARVGVVDVSLENTAIEATLPPESDPVRAALRAADTYDPDAFTPPVARSGGITSAIVVPAGGQVSGLAAWVDLIERDAVREPELGLVWGFERPDAPGGQALMFARMRELLADTALFRSNRGAFISNKLRELSVSAADLEVLARALSGELPVMLRVDRAADIRTALEIARAHELDVVLVGAAEGWRVADRIAAARVPVVLDPLLDVPLTFDTLQARADNAVRLHRAGVKVAFSTLGDPHLAHRLRQGAGNAVAAGLPWEVALAAITRVPAEIGGRVDAGVLKPGALANLVVWNGDPLEVTTWAERLWIRGREIDLHTRQDALTERYR